MSASDLRRMRLLVAIAQLLALGGLIAAAGPLFTATPAPLGRSVGVGAVSIALAFVLARAEGAAGGGRRRQLLVLVAMAFWAVLALALGRTGFAPSGQAVFWAVMGVSVFVQALGTALADGDDQARGLALRAGLAGAAAAVLGALTGQGPLPGAAALGLLGLGAAVVAHAVARSLVSGVDTARVGRSAAVSVGIVGALAVLLSIGPVSRAAAAALEAVLGGIGLALALVASPFAYLLYALLSMLHPHFHAIRLPPHPPGRAPKTPPAAAAAHPLVLYGAEAVLLAAAALAVILLVGRARRAAPPPEGEAYRDEILPPEALRRPRPRRRHEPPPPGLRRTYAEALGVLSRAADETARPAPGETPAAIERRLGRALDPASEALSLFRRLSGAYALLRYGGGPENLPVTRADVLSALRKEIAPARRPRRGRPPRA